ncbi:unnamed protein product [Choristocarpus tenellus]
MENGSSNIKELVSEFPTVEARLQILRNFCKLPDSKAVGVVGDQEGSMLTRAGAGVVVDEENDTWGFSWMPAIEEFMENTSKSVSNMKDIDVSLSLEEEGEGHTQLQADGSSEEDIQVKAKGRKRKRTSSISPNDEDSLSYNGVLLADKSFHNPHAAETMANAYAVSKSFSFLVDVADDDREWGGSSVEGTGVEIAESGGWFYDTVREKQNRSWADKRVKKGVELARKGQHQAAVDLYSQALGTCPDHDDGLVARGAAYATMGRLHHAQADLQRALRLDAENANAAQYLKETRRRLGQMKASHLTHTQSGSISVGSDSHFKTSANGTKGQPPVEALPQGAGTRDDFSVDVEKARGEPGGETGSLGTLVEDVAEGERLRKVRLLLEEDAKKRKRERRSGEGGRSDKKAKKKGKRSHKKGRDRDRERDRSSDRRKDKKKGKHRKSKRARSGSTSSSSVSPLRASVMSGAVGRRQALASARPGTLSALESSSSGGEGDVEILGHPILQRKKHSLWGI